jgi:hypothetical protein
MKRGREYYDAFLKWIKPTNKYIIKRGHFEHKKYKGGTGFYYKGDLQPYIHFNCRTDMTVGDIDCSVWDYNKKVLRFYEVKKPKETIKNSQNEYLRFLDKIIKQGMKIDYPEYEDVGIYRITGKPPFTEGAIIMRYSDGAEKWTTEEYFHLFLELVISFEEIPSIK